MSSSVFIDEHGRKWLKFSVEFRNEIDSQTFSFDVWGIDLAHAKEQLDWIKKNGNIAGQIA
jgi:streptogramin lyase